MEKEEEYYKPDHTPIKKSHQRRGASSSIRQKQKGRKVGKQPKQNQEGIETHEN